MMNKKRIYRKRKGVNWYEGGMPIHNQKSKSDGMYWNEIRGEWCVNKCDSKMLEVGEIRVLDFKCYPLSKIKDEFGAKMYERVGFFITKLYGEHLIRRKAHDWEWGYWDNKKLEVVLGRDHNKVIDAIVAKKIIEIDYVYSMRGNKMKMFKLSKLFKNEEAGNYRVDFIRGGVLTKALKRYFTKLEVRDNVLKYIKNTVLSSSLIIDDLDPLIDKIWAKKIVEYKNIENLSYVPVLEKKRKLKISSDPEKYEKGYKEILRKYYECIQFILGAKCTEEKNALCFVRKSNFGDRISHLFSNTPREYRKHLKIWGSEVVEIDIKASQPSFLIMLLGRVNYVARRKLKSDDPSFEYIKIRDLLNSTEANDLYEYMAIKLYGAGKSAKDPNRRKEMKNLFYRLVYGDPKYKINKVDRKKLITQIFGANMFKIIEKFSSNDFDFGVNKTYKNLVALLQRAESSFLMLVIKEHMSRKIPFLPLYDSLIVRKQDEAKSRAIFNYVIEKRKLKEYISIK